jgi:hypothetical protein
MTALQIMGVIRVAPLVPPSGGKRQVRSRIKRVDEPWEQSCPSYHVADGLHGGENAVRAFGDQEKGRVSKTGGSNKKQVQTITNERFFWLLQKE